MNKSQFLGRIKQIHFIGICGYIMSATAVMLKKMGYEITGSDQNAYPPATETVDRAGIKRFEKHSPANFDTPDLVVIGNHISEDNLEAHEAIKRDFKIISLPELIGKIFFDKKRIVVGGSHGKTTTTSLIAWILETSGLDPSYLVGGIMRNTGRGFKLGKGNFFVIEGDEYRTAFFDQKPKFFHYKPDVAVLTTCELDHPDYFDSFSKVKDNFFNFLNLVPKDGLVVCGIDDPQVEKIFKKIKRPKVSYGLRKGTNYQAINLDFGEKATKFKVKKKNGFIDVFRISSPGKINVQNALAAIAVSDYLRIPIGKIKKGLASFRGAARRFEIVGSPKGVTIVDDYAHHPTKIKKTLEAARARYPKAKIYCVFEPHTYSRTKTLFADYIRAFGNADEVIIADLMPAREAGQKPSITSEELTTGIKKHHLNVRFIASSPKILKYLVAGVKKDDVVIVMSVGGLDGLARNLVNAIGSRSKAGL